MAHTKIWGVEPTTVHVPTTFKMKSGEMGTDFQLIMRINSFTCKNSKLTITFYEMFCYYRSNGDMYGDGSSPVHVLQTTKTKTLENRHIECSPKQSFKKVRFVENTTNEKSDSNRRIESVDYTVKREQINRNEHDNEVGSGKSNPFNRGKKYMAC